jgi:prepilin-type N-terminal cleavage/methylation domain-containing protein/prepilin-type processing-associated H-X9-DG protein
VKYYFAERKMKKRHIQHGFSLTEMLVVLAILAVLIAFLLTTIERALFSAKCVSCMSNLRQWVHATRLYATDHLGQLPSYNLHRSTGDNMWDQDNAFLPSISKYIGDPKVLYCPFDDLSRDTGIAYNRWPDNSFILLHSYTWWVPRVNHNAYDPPRITPWDLRTGNTLSPTSVGSASAATLPIVADSMSRPHGSNWVVIQIPYPVSPDINGYHLWDGVVDNANIGFFDGHVEVHRARDQDFQIHWEGNWSNIY